MNDLVVEIEKNFEIGSWEIDLKADTLFWSRKIFDIYEIPFGKVPEQEERRSLIHEEDIDRVSKTLEASIEHKCGFEIKFRVKSTSNKIKWVLVNGKPNIENGEVTKVYGTAKEINKELKQEYTQRKIANTFLNYKNSVDTFAVVAETDIDGKITYVNDKFCEKTGYTKSEILGKTHRVLNSGFHPKTFFQDMWQTIKKGHKWSGKVCNRAKDGSLIWYETYISPKYSLNKKLIGFTSMRFDITEKIELEENIQSEQEKATFMSQLAAVGEMSAGIAHEISNPLQIIFGNLMKIEMLKKKHQIEDNLLTDLKKIEEDVKNAATRINKISKGLLKVSHQSRGEDFTLIKVQKLVSETLDFCQESLRGQNIQLTYSSFPELEIECHEVKVSQILLNLINNARDAIVTSNSKERTIHIDIISNDNYIVFTVEDSGPGIPPLLKEKIMQPFFTTKDIGKGSGLGLSLVKRFVAEHNGHFYLLENNDKTIFKVLLPLKQTIIRKQCA